MVVGAVVGNGVFHGLTIVYRTAVLADPSASIVLVSNTPNTQYVPAASLTGVVAGGSFTASSLRPRATVVAVASAEAIQVFGAPPVPSAA